jgi:hypothetical protein
MRKAVGLGGRPRRISVGTKKDRDAVRVAIIRARKKISERIPSLSTHLHKSLEFSPLYRYSPEKPTRWAP